MLWIRMGITRWEYFLYGFYRCSYTVEEEEEERRKKKFSFLFL